ncbi:MAG: hypothetical protein K0S24_1954 [Sphingobacterium sp.]|jgi:hypothetical protein|nr:hypothetical protein [Sphingobacterium sp.]
MCQKNGNLGSVTQTVSNYLYSLNNFLRVGLVISHIKHTIASMPIVS